MMDRHPPIHAVSAGSWRVSLPRFIMLATSIMLFVGLGALVASRVTGRVECVQAFFRGPGALFLVTLAVFNFSLSRLVVRQFAEDEPLQPAWFLIMLSGGCQLVGSVCVQILSVRSPLNPLVYGITPGGVDPGDLQRFGLIVGGPLQLLLLAGGLAYVLRLCRRTRIVFRYGCSDCVFVLIAVAGAYLQVYRLVADTAAGQVLTTYDVMVTSAGPLLVLLLIQTTMVRRCVLAVSGGMISKCWNCFTGAIFLAAVGNLGLWMANYGVLPPPLAETTWYIFLLSATASALGPAWQIEAVQRACGGVGISRFSPVALSLTALRLLHPLR